MIEVIIYLIILATALPVGWLLAWFCEDELIKDRKYFVWLACFLALLALVFIYFLFQEALWSIAYMLIVLAILIGKSKKSKNFKKK